MFTPVSAIQIGAQTHVTRPGAALPTTVTT
jgi:hypothetical protein